MKNLVNCSQQFIDYIEMSVKSDKISHAYLIEIGDYEKDFSLILSFVKMILCQNKSITVDELNCEKCNICSLIDNGNYPDLKIIEPEGSDIKKSQLLELQKDFRNSSFLNNKRIYIIKEADKLNISSANTILKFLEEPEEGIIAVLLTINQFSVLDTIKSRCQILSLNKNYADLFDKNDLELMRLMLINDQAFINYNNIISDILVDKLTAKKKLKAVEDICIKYLESLENRFDKNCFQDDVYIFLSKFGLLQIIGIISIIEEEMVKLDSNVNYKLWLDSFLAKLIKGGCING